MARVLGTYRIDVEVLAALEREQRVLDRGDRDPLRLGVKDVPALTAEFELDDNGAVTRLIAQPLGIFLPKEPG